MNPEPMERSLTGESSHGDLHCSEAPQGTTKQSPYSLEASGTPARWEEHLSPYSPSSENLEVLAEKAPWIPRSRKENHSGSAEKQAHNGCQGLLADLIRTPKSGASAREQSDSDHAGPQGT
jgi:hypothetical protein